MKKVYGTVRVRVYWLVECVYASIERVVCSIFLSKNICRLRRVHYISFILNFSTVYSSHNSLMIEKFVVYMYL